MNFVNTIKDLEELLFNLHPDAKKHYTTISNLKDIVAQSIKQENVEVHKLVFDKNASAMEQVLFGLKYIGKASKIGEIESAIREFDRDFDKGLNTPIDKLKRADKVDIYNPTGSNHTVYYALTEWFDGEELKESYKPI